MKSKSKATLPIPVKRALSHLGRHIREARIKRRIPTAIMSERCFISRMTLNKVEKGDPSVSMGVYATVLFVLGLTNRLEDLINPKYDNLGLLLQEEQLPKRIRQKRQFDKSHE
jgi:hypothetical protein